MLNACDSTAPRAARGEMLASSLDTYRFFKALAAEANADKRERFYVAMLDVKNRVVGAPFLISLGSLSASIVHPREAFREAVKTSAHAVIFMHNHPSGDPTPSEEDFALTRRLVAAGEVLGIRVLDHVVIGDGDWHSFADAGSLR